VGDVVLGKYANLAKSLRNPIGLKVLGFGDDRPMELIMPLLNKVTENDMLSWDISLKGRLLPLNRLQGSLLVIEIVGGGRLGRTRSS